MNTETLAKVDESRQQFEAWFEKYYGPGYFPWEDIRCDSGYSDEAIDCQWEAWKAGRSSLAVELPSLKQSETGDRYQWSDGVFHFKHDTADILRAAGITVKGDSDGN